MTQSLVVALDLCGNGPVGFELFEILDCHAVLVDDAQRVLVVGTAISVVQQLHASVDDVSGLSLVNLAIVLLHLFAHQRHSQIRAIPGGNACLFERVAKQIDCAQEGAVLLPASDHQSVPQRVELGATVVEYSGAPRVQGLRLQGVAVVQTMVCHNFVFDDVVEKREVGKIARGADGTRVVDFEDAWHVSQLGH